MAKSKSGGTRSYIRGRVGADVYSIGKDAKGAKQQVVRSLAETVANPQTINQMRGRMIMATVMQAVSGMAKIIDHSFDGVPQGQPCISEFISRNYALIKADVAANASGNNRFALSEYHVKGVKGGRYVISNGEAVLPATMRVQNNDLVFPELATAATIADFKTAIGWQDGDYITFCGIDEAGSFHYVRLKLNTALADTDAISASIANLFVQEGTDTLTVKLQNGDSGKCVYASYSSSVGCTGAIQTKKTDAGYIHSKCELRGSYYADACADVVLPSYPIGTEAFLNGGEL